jgi:eukaryotic-like serine/threonine-protein kinase
MEPPDPTKDRPHGPGVGAGAGDDPLRAGAPIGSARADGTEPDPDATVSHHPTPSGIGPAQGATGPVAIDDIGDFIRELTENKLVESAELERLRQQVSARAGSCDARALAQELVRLGRLTTYQAAALLQGKTKGLLIGNYIVLDKLGAGSMGIVFLAVHRLFNKQVALKLLPPSLARNKAALERFHREAKTAAALSHPNVVAVYDADEFRGLHFLVMEYVEGRDLARLVRENGPLSVPKAIDCIVQAARGLEAAFQASVVHRDIKPSNLLLQPDGTLKILDMGLARMDAVGGELSAMPLDATLTQSNVILGTIDYMSPEQASNPKNADHRSDLYSLGCTLHYLITGRPPFSGETFIERLIAHREQPIPSLAASRPDVSPALDDVLKHILAKSPESRLSSFGELIKSLEACRQSPATDGGRSSVLPIASAPKKPSGPQRATITLLVSGMAATIALVGAAIYVHQRQTDQASDKRTPAVVAPAVASSEPVVQPKPLAPEPVELPPHVDTTKPQAKAIRAAESTKNSSPGASLPNEGVGLVRELKGHKGRVHGVAVSRDGAFALSGGQDKSVRLWSIETGHELRRLEHDGPVYAAALAADGRRGLSGSADKTVRLWDFGSEHDVGVRRLDGHTAAVLTVMFAPGDELALSGSADRTIRVWDAATGQPAGLPLVHESAVVAITSIGANGILAGCEDGSLWLWDLKSRQRVRKLKAPGPILCVAASPLGRRALSGHADGVLVVWDLDLGAEIGRMIGHSDLIRCVAALPDGQRALAGSQFGNLILWDIDSQRELHRLAPAGPASARAGQLGVAASADGHHALSADTDGIVRLWRLPEDAAAVSSGKRSTP